jgi:hypothetical protein
VSARTSVFAGFLHPGDVSLDAVTGLAAIDCKKNAALRTSRELPASDHVRSPRPYVIVTTGFDPAQAGWSMEDIGRSFAAACEVPAAAVPGDALEVWLLPVVSFQLDYLITPAGEWPPPEPA